MDVAAERSQRGAEQAAMSRRLYDLARPYESEGLYAGYAVTEGGVAVLVMAPLETLVKVTAAGQSGTGEDAKTTPAKVERVKLDAKAIGDAAGAAVADAQKAAAKAQGDGR